MAADNEKFGEWKVVSLDIPDFLEDTRETINEIADALLLLLDIALAALNIVKVFVAGFLNPLAAILGALIEEINALIRDLRNIGLYLAGDWNLLEYPFIDLRGGFREYERRMIARLADTSDPSRPDLSSRTDVLGVFFYLSVDVGDIVKLTRFILNLLKFFNQELPVGGLPVPVIQDVKYGFDVLGSGFPTLSSVASVFEISTTPPELAKVIWNVRPTSSKSPVNPYPTPPPPGFVVTVSTLPGGLQVVADQPQASDTKKPSTATGDYIQPRVYSQVQSGGNPVILYGGVDEIDLPESLTFNNGTQSDLDPVDGATRIYAVPAGQANTANTPIPIEALRDGDTYYLQRRYFVSASDLGFLNWQQTGFSLQLDREELPHEALFFVLDGEVVVEDLGPADTYYVRVATLGQDPDDVDNLDDYLVYDFAALETKDPGIPFKVPLKGSNDPQADRSPWSDPIAVTFPNANTEEYFRALETALAVLVLSRADLPLIDDVLDLGEADKDLARADELFVPNVALEGTGLENLRDLLEVLYEDLEADLNETSGNPSTFRLRLRRRVRRVATEIYRATGTIPALEARIVEGSTTLREATWGEILEGNPDSRVQQMATLANQSPQEVLTLSPGENPPLGEMTILDSLDSIDLDIGLAISPYSLGADDATVQSWTEYISGGQKVFLARKPDFIEYAIDEEDITFFPVFEASPDETPEILETAHPALRMFYEKYIGEEGELVIPNDVAAYLDRLTTSTALIGSADRSPIFYVDRQDLIEVSPSRAPDGGAVAFCRNLFAQYAGGLILSEARLVLTLAASVIRRPDNDGQWLAFRLFDTLPFVEEFLEVINRFLNAINESIRGIAEAILNFIEFLEARIVETQQLIKRVNALLQSLLLFEFPVGAQALALVSSGTDGLLADFVSANSKPSEVVATNIEGEVRPEGPDSYGGGVVLVAAFAPSFLVDLFLLRDDPNDPDLVIDPIPGAFTPDALPPASVIGPDVEDEEPDVL